MNSQIRTGVTHLGTAVGGAVAALGFASSHSIDLYAIIDQVNVVVADVAKLIAMVMPLATGAYGVWKASTRQKLADVVADPKTPEVAKEMPVTPQTAAVADALQVKP